MAGQLRHMLRDDDINHAEQKQILELGMKFRENRFYRQPFAGPQAVAVLFDKPSTRTRSSSSIGVAELGGMHRICIDFSIFYIFFVLHIHHIHFRDFLQGYFISL